MAKKKLNYKRNIKQKFKKYRLQRVKEQINSLAQLILKTDNLNLKRAYIKHIRLLSQKVQYPLPPTIKYSFCRRCSEVFTTNPLATYIIRLRSKNRLHLVYTCLKCGYIRRKFIIPSKIQ